MKNFLITSKEATPREVAARDILKEKHKHCEVLLDLKEALAFGDDLVPLSELSF